MRRSIVMGAGSLAGAALIAALSYNAAVAGGEPDDLLGEPAEVTSAGEIVETNAEGDVVKARGERAELVDTDSGEVVFSIAVTDVRIVDSCPGRDDSTVLPMNGKFVVLTIDAHMPASIRVHADGENSEILMPVFAEAFEVADATGNALGSATDASWLCYEPEQLAPPFVGPGERAQGLVVLDSQIDAGQIRYTPGSQTGWAWDF
ncbi:MAG: hypothetical protein L0G23_04000 [Ruaniaceae bacterium]|nr:hypothetical protein [Ruaniaceae bacterium]